MAKKKTKQNMETNIVSKIVQLVDDSIGMTTTWEQNNVKWHKMRMRIKKAKSFPFVGCANLRMPTIETKIRKLKAALTNVIFGIRPVVQVIPTPAGTMDNAIKVEKWLDHLIMEKMKVKPTGIIAVDQALEKGFYLLKPYWKIDIMKRVEKFSIDDISIQELSQMLSSRVNPDMLFQAFVDRLNVDMSPLVAGDNRAAVVSAIAEIMDGEENIEVVLQDVLCNYPDIALCQPERVYVPSNTGWNPQSAEFIVHEFEMPLETVKLNGEFKGWDLGEIQDIENLAAAFKGRHNAGESNQLEKDIDIEKDMREGIEKLDKDNKITIWEYYGWFDINNDGAQEKCVITLAPDFEKVLRKTTLPFDSGKFPFVKIFYELTDDRWFSHRGIPELIEDIVKEIDIQHMQKIDQQTMRNTPMYVHRAGMVNKNAMQFIFGQSLPVHGMQALSDIIQPINNNNPNVEFSYEREQMMLETKVEELIGQIDFTLQSMINKREPRTLGEVQLQHQNMQQVFSLDADMFRSQFEDLFNWIWELWCQYGDDETEFSYFGQNGWEKIRLNREEVQGKYKILVRGNDQNTNPQVRLQKAQMVLQANLNPVALQTGVITPINIAEAYKLFYQELDVPNHERLHQDPRALMQMMQQRQQQQPPPVKLDMDNLTDAEQAQVLAKYNIRPDMQRRQLDRSIEMSGERAAQRKIRVDNIAKLSDSITKMKPKESANAKEKKGKKK